MLKQIIASVAFMSVGALGAGAAFADEYVVENSEGVVVESDDSHVVTHDGRRVYGWTSERPLDCGAYHYWDGEDCVDARAVPPDTGPKD